MSVTKIQGGTIFLNGQLVKTDLLIENGKIAAIGNELSAADTIIDASGKLVTPGLIDLHVHFRDPGLTQKKRLKLGQWPLLMVVTRQLGQCQMSYQHQIIRNG